MNSESNAHLENQLNRLRLMFAIALALLVVMTASVAWHFRSQKQLMNVQLSQANMNINQYEKQFMPQLQALVTQLQEYSKTHPDIKPLLAKYGMLESQAPSPAPTPKPTTAPKK